MSAHVYFVVLNHHDNPVELVRVSPDTQKALVIAPSSSPSFAKQSHLFHDIQPRLDSPYCFQLVHAGSADAPVISEWLEACNQWAERGARKRTRGRYKTADAKTRVIDLLAAGVSLREAERLTGVPKSTALEWRNRAAGAVQ